MRIETTAAPEEKVELVVELIDVHNGMKCLRLGQIEFEVELVPAS